MNNFLRSPRKVATGFFLLAAMVPIGIWIVYLFVGNTEISGWLERMSYAFSSENDGQYFFILISVTVVFSFVAAFAVALQRHRAVLRVLIVGGVAQAVALAMVGAWTLAFVAALPLWWLFRAQHEV